MRLNREVAAQEIFRAEHRLAAQQQRVSTDVRTAFYQVLIAQLEASSLPEIDKFVTTSGNHADRLRRAGEISAPEAFQLRSEIGNARNMVEAAKNRRVAAWERLAAVVGQPNLPEQDLSGDPEVVTNSEPRFNHHVVLDRLLMASPEIAAAMTEIERARWAAERARVEKTPNVTVQGLVNWRDNGIGGRSDGAITVGVPLPIWNRNQGRVVEAAQEAAAAERALQQLELDLKNRLAPVFERYLNAHDLARSYKQAGGIKELNESLRLTLALWPAALGTRDFLIELRILFQIRQNYFDALRELRSTEAEIDGLLLSGSLENR